MNYDGNSQSVESEKEESHKKTAYVTIVLVLLQIILFYLFDSEQLYAQHERIVQSFGVQWNGVMEQKQYYRLITYMFLHSNFEHLVNNMILLFFVGQNLEHILNASSYLLLYMGSGIIAGVVSMCYYRIQHVNVLSIGASGAIYGLLGATLYRMICKQNGKKEYNIMQLILFFGFSLYGDYVASNIDQAAHIGGFLGGIVLVSILIRRKLNEEDK